jgi:pyruvate/2-oxoglutarate dehydrogenase complex dihydrolipoamide dehydrogenase (E3) component
VSEAIYSAFSRRGIEVIRGTVVTQIDANDDGSRRVTFKGPYDTTSNFDSVIAAVGWPGNLEELDLTKAGIETERGYIKVSHTLQTSTPHVYAAGDITGRMMLVQSARDEGRVAAENALTKTASANEHAVVPHGSFTDPEYGSVGITELRALEKFNAVSATVPYLDNDRAVIDSHVEGFCKLIVDPATRRLVGAHVVGQQAVEIVQVAAAAIHAETSIDKLAVFEYAYPTYTSIIGLAAKQILNQLDPASEDEPGDKYLGDWESEIHSTQQHFS